MSRVTSITVARLYNLGNYEHLKYELTVEIAPDDSAGQVMQGVENLMTALDPKRPAGVLTSSELARQVFEMAQIKAMSEEDVLARYLETKDERLNRMQKKHEENRSRSLSWFTHRDKARRLLDDLGGAATFTDAKLDWEDDYE